MLLSLRCRIAAMVQMAVVVALALPTGACGSAAAAGVSVDLSRVTRPELKARLDALVVDSFMVVPITSVFRLRMNDRALQALSELGVNLSTRAKVEAIATNFLNTSETGFPSPVTPASPGATKIPASGESASALNPETVKPLPDVGEYQEDLENIIAGRVGTEEINIAPTDDNFEDALKFLKALQTQWSHIPDIEIPEIEHLWTTVADRPDVIARLQELTTGEEALGASAGSAAAVPPPPPLQVDPARLREALGTVLSVSRHHGEGGRKDLEAAALYVSTQLDAWGLLVFNHDFSAHEYPVWYGAELEGTNVVGVLRGQRWGQPEDAPVVIGAHLDTVDSTPGVDDNGSGVAGLLEAARVLATSECHFKNSIIFVAFDLEEIGTQGSAFFVKDFLGVLLRNTLGLRQFTGAFILDCIANWDPAPDSQDIPEEWYTYIPRFTLRVEARGSRGDFAAMIYRRGVDGGIAHTLAKYYWRLGEEQYRLEPMAVSGLKLQKPNASILMRHFDMLRSDHVRFWYPDSREHLKDLKTIPAVLVSDLGPFRGHMRECYHLPCDGFGEDLVNLGMTVKVTQALVWALAELAEGRCGHRKAMSTKQLFEVMTMTRKKGKKPVTTVQAALELLHSLGALPRSPGAK